MNYSTLYHPTTLTIHLSHAPQRCCFIFPSSAFRQRRHQRRNLLRKPLPTTTPPPATTINSPSSSASSQQQTLQLQITLQPPNSLSSLLTSSKFYLARFILSSQDAFEDLGTLIKFENQTNTTNYNYSYNYNNTPRRVVVSCKRSTLEFLGTVLISSFVIFYAFRVVFKLGKFLFSGKRNDIGGEVVYRRDRSLGGKLVAVGKKEDSTSGATPLNTMKAKKNNETVEMDQSFWDWGSGVKLLGTTGKKNRLPTWWPDLNSRLGPSLMMDDEDKEEYQKMANRFIRAIMDNRLRGKDITVDDIIQLRRICKTYGVKVSIDTENARDSLYRTSVNFVLNHCESLANGSAAVQIDGEDVQPFIAGLADNIGLDYSRAAKMVSAAVAARTRSLFLQAWALEMQGEHTEALMELVKLCFIHQIFPPEECSPEMEMVARGLENHLKVDQRKSLMNTLSSVYGEKTPKSVFEALGLVQLHRDVEDQQESMYT